MIIYEIVIILYIRVHDEYLSSSMTGGIYMGYWVSHSYISMNKLMSDGFAQTQTQ